MSNRIYEHCLKNPREQSGHWGWKEKKILEGGQKTVTRPQGIQQRLVSSILSRDKICKHYMQNKLNRMKSQKIIIKIGLGL